MAGDLPTPAEQQERAARLWMLGENAKTYPPVRRFLETAIREAGCANLDALPLTVIRNLSAKVEAITTDEERAHLLPLHTTH